ncbi:MAG: TonB-dependent receptor [Candidatus Zixiibacteriota bacterium]
MMAKRLVIVLPVLCLLAAAVMGATVGKITGVVTDSQTKEPLVGVSVSIVGTTMGASTDQDGRYNILNVPVGTYTLKVSAVGYSNVEIANVEVSADLATYQNQALSSQVTDIGKTISVTAERPLLVKDKTTSINIVKRDDIRAMPTRGFDQVVGLQNSVVRMQRNTNIQTRGQRETANGTASEINLRGGRPSEVAFYVDGFSQQDPLSGVSSANISNNAIKEIAVQSGAFSAEYGHVASGIVQVTTNSGTDKLHGNLDVVTDNLAGKTHSWDQNWYSGDLGGPIPGTDKKGTFFFSGERRFLGDREPSSRTAEVFKEFGSQVNSIVGDTPNRLPENKLSGWSYQGKVDYAFTPTMKLALSGNGSVDNWQEYRHIWLFDQGHRPRYKDKNMGLNAKLTQTLNANTFYNLSASYFMTSRVRGDAQIFDNYSAYLRPYSDPEEDGANLFMEDSGMVVTPILDTNGVDTVGFDTSYVQAYYKGLLKRKSAYIGLKGDITSRVSSHHTLRAGFDFQRHTIRFYQNLDPTLKYAENLVNRYGYDSVGNEENNSDYLHKQRNPINLGVFVEDRFDWQSLVVQAGLRFDYFDYKALRIKDVKNPLDPDSLTGVQVLDPGDLEPSKKFSRLSPRLGIGFPVSDVTQMHINFGKFYQRPDLLRLYLGYDFFAARIKAGSYYPFPSPNLEPEKTTQYEVGISHQLGANTAVDVTAYYKDVQGLTQIFHQSPAAPKVYDFFANTDFGTIKGVDFSFNLRRTHSVEMSLKYTLAYATGTGSYAQSHYIIAWQNPKGETKVTNPLDFDQRHSLIGVFDIRAGKGEGPKIGGHHLLENAGVNFIVQASSGTPYTPVSIDNEITLAAYTPKPIGGINSASLPWTFHIDLKAEKSINFGGRSITPYLVIKNVLNAENVVAVYEGTGKAYETGYLTSAQGQIDYPTGSSGYDLYNLAQNDPRNYGAPRQWLFGVRMSF